MKNRLSIEEYRERYYDPAPGTSPALHLYQTEPEDCRLPRRKPLTHKYSYGRALIIGGCRGFSGAPVLAANACERSGSGLTHLMVPDSIYAIAAARCDGAVVTPLPAGSENGGRLRGRSRTGPRRGSAEARGRDRSGGGLPIGSRCGRADGLRDVPGTA